ncbi:MAG: AAA family ATPase [Acidimicrobiales bacterium]
MADLYLAELCADFPAVMITGPRTAGKTTTAAQHVEQIVRLDQPGVAAAFRADPDAALRRAARPVLLDEWHAVPEVLAAVKRSVDSDTTPGQFILTGSVRAELGNETWAGTGRIVRMSMYPLVERELQPRLDLGRSSFLARLTTSSVDELIVPPEDIGFVDP